MSENHQNASNNNQTTTENKIWLPPSFVNHKAFIAHELENRKQRLEDFKQQRTPNFYRFIAGACVAIDVVLLQIYTSLGDHIGSSFLLLAGFICLATGLPSSALYILFDFQEEKKLSTLNNTPIFLLLVLLIGLLPTILSTVALFYYYSVVAGLVFFVIGGLLALFLIIRFTYELHHIKRQIRQEERDIEWYERAIEKGEF